MPTGIQRDQQTRKVFQDTPYPDPNTLQNAMRVQQQHHLHAAATFQNPVRTLFADGPIVRAVSATYDGVSQSTPLAGPNGYCTKSLISLQSIGNTPSSVINDSVQSFLS
ncbi:hypothetical protein K4K61_001571 [Colletotrichum sp. SAR11_59]|nr:hypothetical protein K4K61_001571 [Colletotrichum sp. SAR11_59]